jgi:tryptophan synthase beta chain
MASADTATKILLDEAELPTHWHNIVPDLPHPPAAVLHPGTQQPIGPADLAPLFPMALIQQEVSSEPRIEIPEEVREIYRLWRPTPLFRAARLERALATPAHIYYKYEGVSPAGSHKPNTAVAQAYYNKAEGIRRLTTETGAGQWGSALGFACALFGLECTVYMVKASYMQKPYRRSMIETYGARVIASPSEQTRAGQTVLSDQPDSPGSLGMAISEAVEDAATHDDAHYSLGSVLNHVLLHQTVIGQEALLQMDKAGEYPDVVIGCVGGGSNFAGLAFPFVSQNLRHGRRTRIIAVEPEACPTLTRGLYAYDFGDTVGLTPLVKMYTLGHTFVPSPIHAGGLRYHGDAPLVCQLLAEGLIEAVAQPQTRIFEAGVQFARSEGIIPAPESAHAVRSAIDAALEAREAGERRVILFNLSGHGHFDMGAYDEYFAGRVTDYVHPDEAIQAALRSLPSVASPT